MAEMMMGRRWKRKGRSAWPLALSVLLVFISPVESSHANGTAAAAYIQETSEQSLLKARRPPGGVGGGESSGNNGASAGTGNGGNENGATPSSSSSSSPYGKVIPAIGGATAVAATHRQHQKGNAYRLSCNQHLPAVLSITMLSAVALV